jgi:hypothetical protein
MLSEINKFIRVDTIRDYIFVQSFLGNQRLVAVNLRGRK